MRVEDVMTGKVATVGPATPLKEVAAILVERNISGLPVVDESGRVLGVVSERDIVEKEATTAAPGRRRRLPRRRERLDDLHRVKLAATTAAEAMTSPALTIDASRPLAEAASLMVANGVKRLPVVAAGRLVGIVSRADLVRAFLRSDEEIANEIREEVAFGTFAIPPESLHVEVSAGQVTLGGEVETFETVDLLTAFAARVPGVVSVRSHLTSRTNGKVPPRP